jgi:uncharacterized protein YceK
MKNVILILTSITLVALLSGCGTMGTFRANNQTNVELSQPNFRIVARNLQGSATQGYLFGVSIPQGSDIGSFALVRISGVDKPYATALNELWENYTEKYGAIKCKKLALINIRQDTETLNTLVYTEAKYFITADVIEFIK